MGSAERLGKPALDRKHCTGHAGGEVAGEVEGGACNIVLGRHASEGRLFGKSGQCVFPDRAARGVSIFDPLHKGVRCNRPRRERIDTHAVFSKIECRGSHQADHGVLCRGVEDLGRMGPVAVNGCHQHGGPVRGGRKRLCNRLQCERDTGHIDAKYPVPFVQIQLCGAAPGRYDPCIGDQDVDLFKPSRRLLEVGFRRGGGKIDRSADPVAGRSAADRASG